MVAVAAHLGDERDRRVELQLVAQVGDELHPGDLVVEVAVEVEQVGLEQREGLVVVEGGSAPERDGGGVGRRRRDAGTSRRRCRRGAGRRRRARSRLAVGNPRSRAPCRRGRRRRAPRGVDRAARWRRPGRRPAAGCGWRSTTPARTRRSAGSPSRPTSSTGATSKPSSAPRRAAARRCRRGGGRSGSPRRRRSTGR